MRRRKRSSCLMLTACLALAWCISGASAQVDPNKDYDVITCQPGFAPFVMPDPSDETKLIGYDMDLWEHITTDLNMKYTLRTGTFAEVLESVENRTADVGFCDIFITADRELRSDYAHSYLQSGLQVVVSNEALNTWADIGLSLSGMFTPLVAFTAVMIFLCMIVVSHFVWFVERGTNLDINIPYYKGLLDAVWLTFVSITTVGYGDKAPKTVAGKVATSLWLIMGLVLFSLFTGSITSQLTIEAAKRPINGPEDLQSADVAAKTGCVKDTSGIPHVRNKYGINIEPRNQYETPEKMLEAIAAGEIVAGFFDSPTMHYLVQRNFPTLKVVGPVFFNVGTGISVQKQSLLRDPISHSILQFMSTPQFAMAKRFWFQTETLDSVQVSEPPNTRAWRNGSIFLSWIVIGVIVVVGAMLYLSFHYFEDQRATVSRTEGTILYRLIKMLNGSRLVHDVKSAMNKCGEHSEMAMRLSDVNKYISRLQSPVQSPTGQHHVTSNPDVEVRLRSLEQTQMQLLSSVQAIHQLVTDISSKVTVPETRQPATFDRPHGGVRQYENQLSSSTVPGRGDDFNGVANGDFDPYDVSRRGSLANTSMGQLKPRVVGVHGVDKSLLSAAAEADGAVESAHWC